MDAPVELLLLPGMDGTAQLFGPLLAEIPPKVRTRAVAYPTDRIVAPDDLVSLVREEVAGSIPVVLVAESFSGPIALRAAEALGPRVRAIVMVASFATNPTPLPAWLASFVPDWPFRPAPPAWALRALLLGDASSDLVAETSAVIASVDAAVLAARVRDVLTLSRSALPRLPRTPLLYLRASRDRLVSPRSTRVLEQTGATVEVVDVPGPHLLAQREPARVWAEIQAFLRRCGISIE